MLLGSACAGQSLHPETAPGTPAIVQEAAGLRLSVEPGAWKGRPSNLPDYVLPFLVGITNGTARPVTLSRTDFFLLDEANRQYLPLPPIEVVSLVGGRGSSGVAVSPSIGIGGSTGGGTIFGSGLEIFFGGYGTDTRDVIPAALAEGPIQPGAEMGGFLYFPLPASGYTALRLVVIIRDLPGEPRLDFEFRRTPG